MMYSFEFCLFLRIFTFEYFAVEDESDIEVIDNIKKNSSFAVDFVTEDNIKNVSINNILLPLPGHSVTYPKNESKLNFCINYHKMDIKKLLFVEFKIFFVVYKYFAFDSCFFHFHLLFIFLLLNCTVKILNKNYYI